MKYVKFIKSIPQAENAADKVYTCDACEEFVEEVSDTIWYSKEIKSLAEPILLDNVLYIKRIYMCPSCLSSINAISDEKVRGLMICNIYDKVLAHNAENDIEFTFDPDLDSDGIIAEDTDDTVSISSIPQSLQELLARAEDIGSAINEKPDEHE